jgi:hypothetical protein
MGGGTCSSPGGIVCRHSHRPLAVYRKRAAQFPTIDDLLARDPRLTIHSRGRARVATSACTARPHFVNDFRPRSNLARSRGWRANEAASVRGSTTARAVKGPDQYEPDIKATSGRGQPRPTLQVAEAAHAQAAASLSEPLPARHPPSHVSVEPSPVAIVQDNLHILDRVEVHSFFFPDAKHEVSVERTATELPACVLLHQRTIGL